MNPYKPTGDDLVDFPLRPGLTIRCPHKAAYGFWWFTDLSPECKAEMQMFLDVAASKKCLLDVGAYHGMFAFAFAGLDHGRIAHAFEPSPILWDTLNLIRMENPDKNVQTYQLALSDREALLDARTEFGVHVILSPGLLAGTNCSGPNDPNCHVRAVTGDSMEIEPDIIKIDVEGHEVRVLRGLMKTITKHLPHIFIELHGLRIVDDGCSIKDIVDLLSPLGYAVVETSNGRTFTLPHMLSYPVGSEIQRVMLRPPTET